MGKAVTDFFCFSFSADSNCGTHQRLVRQSYKSIGLSLLDGGIGIGHSIPTDRQWTLVSGQRSLVSYNSYERSI